MVTENEEQQVGSIGGAKKDLVEKLKSMHLYPNRYVLVPVAMFESMREMREIALAGQAHLGTVNCQELKSVCQLYPTVVMASSEKAIEVGLADLHNEIEKAGNRTATISNE